MRLPRPSQLDEGRDGDQEDEGGKREEREGEERDDRGDRTDPGEAEELEYDARRRLCLRTGSGIDQADRGDREGDGEAENEGRCGLGTEGTAEWTPPEISVSFR